VSGLVCALSATGWISQSLVYRWNSIAPQSSRRRHALWQFSSVVQKMYPFQNVLDPPSAFRQHPCGSSSTNPGAVVGEVAVVMPIDETMEVEPPELRRLELPIEDPIELPPELPEVDPCECPRVDPIACRRDRTVLVLSTSAGHAGAVTTADSPIAIRRPSPCRRAAVALTITVAPAGRGVTSGTRTVRVVVGAAACWRPGLTTWVHVLRVRRIHDTGRWSHGVSFLDTDCI
jgi:hypothetical protein